MCVCAMFLVLVSDSDPSPSHSSRRLRQHGWREPTPNGGSSRKREGHPSSRRRPRTPRCGHRPQPHAPRPRSSGSSKPRLLRILRWDGTLLRGGHRRHTSHPRPVRCPSVRRVVVLGIVVEDGDASLLRGGRTTSGGRHREPGVDG